MRRLKAASAKSATTKSASPTMADDSPVRTGARRNAEIASRSACVTALRARHLVRGRVVHEPALVQLEHACERVATHELEVVRGHHDGHPLRVDVAEQVHHAAGR